jgi:hypothetical protein
MVSGIKGGVMADVIDRERDNLISHRIQAEYGFIPPPCVIVNCSISIPDVVVVYQGVVPKPVLDHTIRQSWKGILSILSPEAVSRKYVLAHVRGIVNYVVLASNWMQVHDNRVMFDIDELKPGDQMAALIGLDISKEIQWPSKHSAVYLN